MQTRTIQSGTWAVAVAGAAVLLLAGCKDPSERFEGPGGSRLQPVVRGGTRFADDRLAVSIEANAFLEEAEPHILQVEVFADGVKVADPQFYLQRWHGSHGYAQVVGFTAPPGARSVEAAGCARFDSAGRSLLR